MGHRSLGYICICTCIW